MHTSTTLQASVCCHPDWHLGCMDETKQTTHSEDTGRRGDTVSSFWPQSLLPVLKSALHPLPQTEKTIMSPPVSSCSLFLKTRPGSIPLGIWTEVLGCIQERSVGLSSCSQSWHTGVRRFPAAVTSRAQYSRNRGKPFAVSKPR